MPSFLKKMEENDEIFFMRQREEEEVEDIINEVLMLEGKYENIEIIEESVF